MLLPARHPRFMWSPDTRILNSVFHGIPYQGNDGAAPVDQSWPGRRSRIGRLALLKSRWRYSGRWSIHEHNVSRVENAGMHDGYGNPGRREVAVALRVFVGEDRQEWQVWDTRPTTALPNADRSTPDTRDEVPRLSKKREGGWLTFTTAGHRRRLSPIPDDWETADEMSLRAMLAKADRVETG